MHQTDASNTVFNLAADLVNHTSRHIFITGKAGTGKTTFLKFIKETSPKNTVIVAPTGVAAINAGGVTMHSFFQLPFGPFIPSTLQKHDNNNSTTDKHSLFKNIHFTSAKRELLQEMELLIIDEVSMVRSDMLDAIDTILRHFRRQPQLAFGGVQVVYIGDMFQLPPVVQQHEWNILQNHYESPFFFNSKAVKEIPPLYIELKKIYRQSETFFIDILNRIRNNAIQTADLSELNKRFDPQYSAPSEENVITLTTHNSKADVINDGQLKKLLGKLHVFSAEINGEFSDKAFPTDMKLQLKEGAQVMFIKNDVGMERRYYNGKLATVKKITSNEVIVSFDNNEEDLKLEKETWKNIRYNYNREKDEIEEEELGSFSQFPIRLAWAITIHKSQGLTFEKAIIDAGSSFAPGQVYVALSRCRSLDGLVLHSKISSNAITTDQRVIDFAKREANDSYLEELLAEEKARYQASVLIKCFNWTKVVQAVTEWEEIIPGKKLPNAKAALELSKTLLEKAKQQEGIAEKFKQQLAGIIPLGNKEFVHERVNKAILYLGKSLVEEILIPLQDHLSALQYASKVKKYCQEVRTFEAIILCHLEKLNNVSWGDFVFEKCEFRKASAPVVSSVKLKSEKGMSQRDTLALHQQGKSVSEIAELRNLAISTIETHLASFISTGEIDIDDLVDPQRTKEILKGIDNMEMTATSIKQKLGDNYTYGEIKAVMSFYRMQQSKLSQSTKT